MKKTHSAVLSIAMTAVSLCLPYGIANALTTTLSYQATNNFSKTINVKLKKYNGDTKQDIDLKPGASTNGSWQYDINSTIHQVVVKVSYSGSNNDIGCTVYPGSSYVGFDRTLNVIFGNDRKMSVRQCDGPNGCHTVSCTAVILNP